MKVAIIGAGNVGAMVASRVIDADLADVVLVDIVPGMAKGKALDISDARPIVNSGANIIGTENFKDIKGSDIIVITAGLARKPGMSRDDLLKKNSEIIKDISIQVRNYCPSSIVIVVTNPLDAMSYLVMKTAGFDPKKVIGMAGVLDTARFINILKEKNNNIDEDKFLMMGGHGDTMVPVSRSKNISKRVFQEASERARNRGAEIVKYLGTGSAYFAPSASVFFMLKIIIKDENGAPRGSSPGFLGWNNASHRDEPAISSCGRRMYKTICASAYLEGQYGEKDIYIGVPIILGSSGVEKIIEIEFIEEEKRVFKESARQIRESISKIL